jgi:hypothetical protein
MPQPRRYYASADGSELMAAHTYHEQQQYITNIGEDIVEFYQQLGTIVTHKSHACHTRAQTQQHARQISRGLAKAEYCNTPAALSAPAALSLNTFHRPSHRLFITPTTTTTAYTRLVRYQAP